MIREIAWLEVVPGQEVEFECALSRAVPLFQNAKGCRGMEIQRSLEAPNRYRLHVRWDSLEDHMVHFRGSDAYREWRALIGSHLATQPQVEHVSMLPIGFNNRHCAAG